MVIGDPWVALPVDLVRGVEQLGERLGIAYRLEQIEPGFVLDPVGLHLRDRLAARLELLCREHLARIVQCGLDDGEHVQRVRRRRPVEQFDRGQGEGGQGLVEREVELKVDGQPYRATGPVRFGQPLDHSRGKQRPVDGDRPPDVPALCGTVLVVVGQQLPGRGERVPGTADDVEQHGMADREGRRERLGLGRDQPVEGRPAVPDRALRWLAAHHLASLLRIVAFSFSTTCSGACTTTLPTGSYPARPARPAI